MTVADWYDHPRAFGVFRQWAREPFDPSQYRSMSTDTTRFSWHYPLFWTPYLDFARSIAADCGHLVSGWTR